jgi:PadR family transcriptional regulator PadR
VADLRFCTSTARLVRVFLAAPTAPLFGWELMTAAELPSVELYPLLAQLERAGWVEGHWEPLDPLVRNRYPRRYYRLTADGFHAAQCAFASAGVKPAAPPPIRAIEPCGACRIICPMAMAMLQIARYRLPRAHRTGLYREWRAELEHLLRCGDASLAQRLGRGIRYARGLLVTSSKIARDLGPCRVPPPVDPLALSGAQRRLAVAERARDAAVARQAAFDVDEDPVGEFLALHTVLFCQVEVDDAQLAYRTACAIADIERSSTSH